MDVTDTRQQLIDYIAAEAVFHGDFTLTSGKKASYYVDLRKVSLDHRVAPLIGRVMIDLIRDIPDVSAVGRCGDRKPLPARVRLLPVAVHYRVRPHSPSLGSESGEVSPRPCDR